jgi:hypothetical protein
VAGEAVRASLDFAGGGGKGSGEPHRTFRRRFRPSLAWVDALHRLACD